MNEYIERIESVRNDTNKLFVSYTNPHQEVGKDTVSKRTLELSGTNTSVCWEGHSINSIHHEGYFMVKRIDF